MNFIQFVVVILLKFICSLVMHTFIYILTTNFMHSINLKIFKPSTKTISKVMSLH